MAKVVADMFFCAILSMVVIGISSKSVDTSFQDELLARILSLESQGRDQAEKMQHMEAQLQRQDERLARQEETINEYKARVGELERALKTCVTEDSEGPQEGVNRNNDISRATKVKTGKGVSRIISTNDHKAMTGAMERAAAQSRRSQNSRGPKALVESRDNVNDNDDHNTMTTTDAKEVIRKRLVLVDTGDVVAFHAVIANTSELAHVGVKQTIVFPDVMLNVGGAYHYHTGTFIAPRAGIYIFSTSITSTIKDQLGVAVSIVKKGIDIAGALAYGTATHNDQGSVTVVTQLVAGDEVWVGLAEPADAAIWGGYLTGFMGCLLVAL